MDVPASLLDFSLVQETSLDRRHRFPRLDRVSRPVRIVFLMLVSWLPLLALSLLEGGPVAHAFLRNVATHVEFLVSLPLLVAADGYIDMRLAAAVRHFVISELIDARHLPRYEAIARDTMRGRRSGLIEAGLLVISFAPSFVHLPYLPNRPSWLHVEPGGPLTLAGWWYLAVSMPIIRFLLLRWLWRAILWATFLFKVSRLPLALVPTHPDAAGGLSFLGTIQASFSLIVLAVSCTLTAQRLSRAPSTNFSDYALHLFAFALLCLAVIFAPLLPFFRQLLRAKRTGDHEFSAVAAWHSQHFEQRWFQRELPKGLDPLTAEDFSSLTDLGTSFKAARAMRWFPVDIRAALAVVAAAMAPMVPLLLADRRFIEVLLELGKSVL
ncbi:MULTISPECIES: hypothetical protein [unclassified Corallococcus]|uniref:hypothetical protein n=1 Tax=unclassified Corallococcus TaxID=2685029 RepID=UPI001A8E0EF2|nr:MULTISPECIES: hypothetical protein [unclassified Corallococcus]MBN9685718.1 hypothetical protein [Corallococcus sp. NCSPR001]WAS82837.1 hypothetical protein O0N60_26355 [Corallococcus sp. NCRR]